ncbi:MAG: hypothetical protein AB8G86_11635 [Saprospiraceae bacterium]
MKKLATILLLNLMLLPVIWNGIGLVHYVVAHTHTFCTNDSTDNHTHDEIEACLSICQLTDIQPHQQLPVTNDYFELKICITKNSFLNTFALSLTNQVNFTDSYLLEKSFSDDIFHPPIG